MAGSKRSLILDGEDDDKQGNNQGGGGQSRAAKKRAKKKNKTRQQLQQKKALKDEGCRFEDDSTQNDLNTSQSNTKKDNIKVETSEKKDLDVTIKKKKKSIKKKEQKKVKEKCKEGVDENKDDSNDKVRDEDEVMLERFLSVLSPSEILFSSSVEENDHDIDMEREEQEPDPKVVIREVTAEKRARCLFNSILSPSGIMADEFYDEYYEQQPLLITNYKKNTEEHGLNNGKTINHKDTIEKFANNFYDKYVDTKRTDEKQNKEDNNESKIPSTKDDEEDDGNYQRRFDGFLSKKDIEKLIKNYPMQYGKDLNVTKYCKDVNGEMRRITLDLYYDNIGSTEGDIEYIVAEPKDVWSNFEDGCSLRLLCPHKYDDRVYALLSTLELEFGCMVGANAYLTPGPSASGSGKSHQGFAPHYDDIEAFILQLEGFKHWKVYPPMNKGETLPRESSSDYSTQEIEDSGPPVLDVILGPGDVLYMPRGWIHQACTPKLSEIKSVQTKWDKKSCNGSNHSLHLTVSAMQNWSWVDLLEIIIPEAMEAAAKSTTSTSLREGLPRNFLSYMGAVHDLEDDDDENLPEGLKQLAKMQKESSQEEDEEEIKDKKQSFHLRLSREKFRAEAKKRIMRVCKEAIGLLDAGCDQIAKRFLSDRLPPYLTKEELLLTSDNRKENGGKIWPNTMIRLTRPNIARLVLEDGKAVLYHCADNSRVFHGNPLSPMEFELDDAPAIEMILKTSEPHWIRVNDLIHGDIEDKMEIAQVLFNEGILTMLQTDSPDKSVQTG